MGADAFLFEANATALAQDDKNFRLRAREINLLDEIGETILPKTDTPGAKAAKVGVFMEVMVRDCYTKSQQLAFMDGMKMFVERCIASYEKPFSSMPAQQRHALLVLLEKEAKTFNQNQNALDTQRRKAWTEQNKDIPYYAQKEFESLPSHFYTMVKQLTLLGFFTSKTGMTKTLRYLPVPGRYDGNVPYIKEQRAWAE